MIQNFTDSDTSFPNVLVTHLDLGVTRMIDL